jgi:urease accessory protein
MLTTNLLSLLHLTDPTLPIGGFSHSAGLETYVQEGVVKDAATAKSFITGMLKHNMQHTDSALVALAFEAATEINIERLIELDNECTAVKLPREMREASIKLGTRLFKIFLPLCQSRILDKYKLAIVDIQAVGHYPITFGVCAHALGISKQEALAGFYYNAAVGMVTNSVKLIPLGQGDGQQLLFSLQPLIAELVEKTLTPNPDLIGVCCTGFDIRSMQHEQLYSRLYMS